MATTKLKMTLTGLALAALITPLIQQHRALGRLRMENALQRQQLEHLRLENDALSDTDLKAILETVETSDGAQLLAAPRLTTVSGQQAQIQVAELRSIPGVADPVTVGPTIDVIPTWSADDGSIELNLMARINVLNPQEDRE